MEAIKTVMLRSIPLLRLLFAGVFIFAGGAKLLDVAAFAAQLQLFGIADPVLAAVSAHYLPFLEISCGVALLSRRFTLGAVTISIALLAAFEVVLACAWISGIKADCGCFGKFFGSTTIPGAFVRNLGLLAIGTVLLVRDWTLNWRATK